MSDFKVEAADYQKAARALKDADKTIRAEYSKTVRRVARPLGASVLAAGAARLPQRGGLADRVAASTIRVSTAQTRATVALKSVEGYDLKAMDRGQIRHPTYGHGPWVGQQIEAHVFTEAFEAAAPPVRIAMIAAGEQALKRIAAEGS